MRVLPNYYLVGRLLLKIILEDFLISVMHFCGENADEKSKFTFPTVKSSLKYKIMLHHNCVSLLSKKPLIS